MKKNKIQLLIETDRTLQERMQQMFMNNKQLKKDANIDMLTGLYNRRYFNHILLLECRRAERYNRPLALLFADIDDFKSYNDSYGHKDGDLVLVKIGEILQKSFRIADFAFRYGGEEFVILLPESNVKNATKTAEKLRQAISNIEFQPKHSNQIVKKTISIGVVEFHQGMNPNEFVNQADQAMYKAKTLGKNAVYAWGKKDMNIQNLEQLLLTIEKHDPVIVKHQQRTALLAEAIAKEMGLSEIQTKNIYLAALLHDIGKITVPITILSDPKKLSTEKFSIIKNHPKAGLDIIKNMHFLGLVIRDIVLNHHERLNGSGYPNGLKDKDITLECRIVTVADVVDAMTSSQPYRKALSVTEALTELSNNKNQLYDATVVDACIKLFKEKNFDIQLKT